MGGCNQAMGTCFAQKGSSIRQGLPVTTVLRTITDLIRSGLAEEWVGQAVRQALARGMIGEAALEEEVRRRGGQIAAQIHRALEAYRAL